MLKPQSKSQLGMLYQKYYEIIVHVVRKETNNPAPLAKVLQGYNSTRPSVNYTAGGLQNQEGG